MNVEKRQIGINHDNDGSRICVWAPLHERIEIITEAAEVIPLDKNEYGYWNGSSKILKPGTKYKIRINGKDLFPDPASLSQPQGPHGYSEVTDLSAHKWKHDDFNLKIEDYIIYELHTGTFTPQHNFEGIIRKLDYLAELGITAVELMPVSQFACDRNWGYDGVYPFAVHNTYGGPAEFQKLIDECHSRRMAVVLDVVYNHIGPEGNYLSKFGPYFTDKYKTPWGSALNYDDAYCDGVRNFFIENAMMWFRDFHVDALRLDAIHAITDFSASHILRDIKIAADSLTALTGRNYYLIAESDLNDTKFIRPLGNYGNGMDAQWCDDFHHSLHTAVTNERKGYYADFNGLKDLAKSYNNAFVYDGIYSVFRKKIFGSSTKETHGKNYVVYSQNHDQVGNRQTGDRLSASLSREKLKLVAAAVLMSPFIPMLFMGEEWSAGTPFAYFVSHTDPELNRLVSEGRKSEFRSFEFTGETPDPVNIKTFEDSCLKWDEIDAAASKQMLKYYQRLIRLRKKLQAHFPPDFHSCNASADDSMQTCIMHKSNGGKNLYCVMNFSSMRRNIPLPAGSMTEKIFDSASFDFGDSGNESESSYSENISSVNKESVLILADFHV